MPFDKDQLEHASTDVDLDDPTWDEALRAEVCRFLKCTPAVADREFPPPVRRFVLATMSEYGPRTTVERALDKAGIVLARGYKARPLRSHHTDETRRFAEREAHPESWDAVGLARLLGKEDALEDALAAADALDPADLAAEYTAERRKADPKAKAAKPNDPKVKRNMPARAHKVLLDELTGAAAANRRRQAEPI